MDIYSLDTCCINELPNSVPRLDIAVLENNIVNDLTQNNPLLLNVIDLNIIDISYNNFINIFYFNCDSTFEVRNICQSSDCFDFISLLHDQRDYDCGKPFCLFDVMIESYANDAGISTCHFSPFSLISLRKQLNQIKSVYDVWNNKTLIKSNNITLSLSEIKNALACDGSIDETTTTVVLTITCIFTPTPGTTGGIVYRPVAIKLNYRIRDFDLTPV